MTERSPPIEIDDGNDVWAVTFSANGEHLLSGGLNRRARVRRASDGEEVATLNTGNVFCFAVSKNGRWIATGTLHGNVSVWDARTYELVFKHDDTKDTHGVDFSPDSTQLVTASDNCTATILEVPTGKQIQRLRHPGRVFSARYSPEGDRIATSSESIRIWDSADGHLLVEIPVRVTSCFNKGLFWYNNHLFGVSGNTVKQLDPTTGSTISEWPVPDGNYISCIVLPKYGGFIAYSTKHTVTLWDMSTHAQFALVEHPQEIRSIALSLGERFLAVGGVDGKISIKSLSRIIDSIPLSRLHPTFQEPDIQIDGTALALWKYDQLKNVETLLTTAIPEPQHLSHHLLAARALVRARLRHWNDALVDADTAIGIQPSVIAYIAKSMAHLGNGENNKAYRACDIAFERFRSSHISFLLLMKAIIVFMAGEHADAISRIDDLIATVTFNSRCYTIQAYMYLLHGNMCMEHDDHKNAIQSFERALAQIRYCGDRSLLVISLITGWKFDNLGITIRQRLCEALYIVSRTKDAGQLLLEIVNTFEEEVYTSGPITMWVSDFTQRLLSSPGDDGDISSNDVPTPLLEEWAKATLASVEWKDALATAANFTLPKVIIYRVICERLKAINHAKAIKCFHEMMNELGDDVHVSKSMTEWVCNFMQQRLTTLESSGDAALYATQDTSAATPPANPAPLLREWARTKLTRNSWKDTLVSAIGFPHSRVVVYQAVCEYLRMTGRKADAVECFHQMMSELGGEVNLHDKDLEWTYDLGPHSAEKLEHLGDTAVDAGEHAEAITYYTTALSLSSVPQRAILIKRGKACLAIGSWQQALDDANQVIVFDPSLPWGYEMKHAALHKGGDYDNAIVALEMMLSKIRKSPDPGIQRHGDKYVNPSSTRATIRKIVQKAIPHLPRVLINTTTGRLHDRAEQASVFESSPAFKELVSSTTTCIDYIQIKREVRRYFRYVMLSHRWEENEPLHHEVVNTTVYNLDEYPTHYKLQTFCRIVRDAGINWAWSDTCCINKSDHFVLQEALVAMFKWYQGSTMTIVFLRGVRSSSQLGALVKSVWNTRAWTLQEYVAAEVIHFYTEDWTLYLDLQIPNHKESSEVISEMEEATGVPAQQLMALRPGLTSIREKLRLASTRQTTLVEDAAYSLLGIFSVTGMPAIYGEGDGSLGRLLSHILSASGDPSVLAWTGESGGFNSCLPAHITVFGELPTSHLPIPISDAEMERMTTMSPSPSFDLEIALRLYDRLNDIPPPWFTAVRMKLSCIAFQLPPLSRQRTRSGRIYRADTVAFGVVEIKTKQDLSRMKSLCLVHPWLNTLLERQSRSDVVVEDDMPLSSPDADDEETSGEDIVNEDEDEFDNEDADEDFFLLQPEPPSVPAAPVARETRARRLVARLRQPFGALLLTPVSTSGRSMDYKRVAADTVISVQFQENFSLADVLENVRTLDVL